MNNYPHDLYSEKIVLGLSVGIPGILLSMATQLESTDFYSPQNQIIFEHLKSLALEKNKASLVSLVSSLKAKNQYDSVGGTNYLLECINTPISKEEYEPSLEIIKDKSSKRKLIDYANQLIKQSENDSTPSSEIKGEAFKNLHQVTQGGVGDIQVISQGDFYEKRMEDLRKSRTRKKLSFCIPELDNFIPTGFTSPDVVVTAARPGQGKSAMKTNQILNHLEAGFAVVSFALEQGFSVEMARLESLMTGIPLLDILTSNTWKKGDPRVKQIKEANQRIDQEFRYHLIPSRKVDLASVKSIMYSIAEKEGEVGIIHFDLFDRLKDVNVASNKAQNTGVKLGELAEIAEEFEAPVNLLVQINREAEKRGNKRPRLGELKDSGSFEEVARLVMLLYREKYYFPDSLNDDIEVIVAKQNNGAVGTVKAHFLEQTLSILGEEDYLNSQFGTYNETNT